MYDFPGELKRLHNWVLWRIEVKNDRYTKVPYSPQYYGRASVNKPNSWGTYNKAWKEFKRLPNFYDGLGLVITASTNLVFIDIDDCLTPHDTGWNDIATDILHTPLYFDYVEISQSGCGLHIITKGTIPRNFKNSDIGVEMYHCKRFVALTGNVLSNENPHCHQEFLTRVYNKYCKVNAYKNYVPKYTYSKNVSGNNDGWIINQASKHGCFRYLYDGKWEKTKYQSQSEADIALCMVLAFWTNRDPEQIDRIFRTSGLYRDKWEREDYRTQTITRACSLCEETLSDYKMKRGEDLDKAMREQWDVEL